MVKSGKAVMENVRRYRAIASLHRQTAAFRPLQRWSLLDQAEQWERLAVAESEPISTPAAAGMRGRDRQPRDTPRRDGKPPVGTKRTRCICARRQDGRVRRLWPHK
jgi:hypothetical protein